MVNKNKKIYTHCNSCKRTTNQNVLFNKRFTEFDDDVPEDSSHYKTHEDYMTIQCGGCENISFLIRNIGSVFADKHDENGYFDENFPSKEYELNIPMLSDEEQEFLPILLRKLYVEVESAFKEEANILAGVGLRMLVEAICLQEKISGRNLQEKIKNLQVNGLLSINAVPILDKLRIIGNFSTHEIKGFSIEKLEYALDIINHTLKSIYVLPKINKRLKI
jgi:Domain of unknown function (DUF4145)